MGSQHFANLPVKVMSQFASAAMHNFIQVSLDPTIPGKKLSNSEWDERTHGWYLNSIVYNSALRTVLHVLMKGDDLSILMTALMRVDIANLPTCSADVRLAHIVIQ